VYHQGQPAWGEKKSREESSVETREKRKFRSFSTENQREKFGGRRSARDTEENIKRPSRGRKD